MQPLKTLSLWLVLACFGLTAGVAYAGPDKDKDDEKERDPKAVQAAIAAAKGTCETGSFFQDLDVNNVRARATTTGSLFYGPGGSAQYEVPNGSGLASIFASGIWIGGQVDGELRMAAATYAQFGADYEFFPGPLNDDGTPPNPDDCSDFDRIWKVSRADVEAFERGEEPTQDLQEWPFELGAAVIDGDGNPNNYNLAGGDRPEVLGDQTLFWVMNDAAGPHLTTLTPPMGLEARVTAFAFNTADALNNTTFYKYEFVHKGDAPIENMFMGLWSDPDLGQFTDDFVGSDTTLGLGFVYNGDNFDEGSAGYQDRPPALGYDFFQGPLVNSNGIDDDGDGEVDEADERLRMTRFVYYNNDNSPQGNPGDADDFFGYLRGRWRDGSRMTVGGDGFGDDLGLGPTNFMFTGNPPEFWSEDNIDGQGTSNVPADRRFLMSTGPFTMNPGDTQELVFGIVWSQTANRIGSVAQLKIDDILAQGAFNFDFDLPRPPDAPTVEAAALNQEIVLKWDYPSNSNNYLNSYNEKSPFLTDPNVQDTTFTFEGYKVYQYASPQDFPNNGEVIATLDEVNNITAITREAVDPSTGAPIVEVAAEGTDAGVQNYLQITQDFLSDQPLNNNTEYYYGVQAYAYNGFSDPPIYQSPISGDPDGGPLVVVPRLTNPRNGGTTLNAQPNVNPDDFDVPGEIGKLADAIIGAEIADPLDVTGDTYELQFYRFDPDGEEGEVAEFLTYDLVNASTGETLVNGREFYANKGQPLPIGTSASPAQGQDVILADGLSFSIIDAPAAISGGGAGIVEVAWAGDPVTPDQYDASGAIYNGNTVWHSLNTTADYYASSGGTGLVSRLERYADFAAPRDFEMRFTEEGGYCTYSFEDDKIATTPFEIWDIGIGTPDDPSDDARMIPFCLSNDGETKDAWGYPAGTEPFFGFPGTDWVYWMDPLPGTEGYAGFANAIEQSGGAGATYNFDFDETGSYFANFYGGFVYPIGRFMLGDFAGDGTPPPPGTTIRVVTTKPIQDGDVFTLETQQFAPQRDQADVLEASLDEITLVPNPYRGSASYDVSNFQSEVRVTNLPERATVRIYTLSGTLIRTLDKVPGTDFLRWDLRTEEGLPIASGIYLVHVNVPDVGERVLKFGVVSPRIQLDVF